MKYALPLFAATAVLATLPAQTTPQQSRALTARQFLLDDYTTVAHFDMTKFRDSGVWDELNLSSLKVLFGMLEEQHGVPIDAVDRFTAVRKPILSGGQVTGHQEVFTVEGNAAFGQPKDVAQGRYEAARVGNHELWVRTWAQDMDADAFVQVTPKLRAYGPISLLKQTLTGHARQGLPSADVMSLTASKPNLLFYFVGDLRQKDAASESLAELLPDATWPADDHPTFVCIRVLATGDEDDPHLKLEAVLRHNKDGQGLVISEQAVTTALEQLIERKESRLFRPLLKKIEHIRKGTDAVWHADLGRARDVAGLLSTFSPMMMFVSTRVEMQQAGVGPLLEVVETIEDETPPPAPKPERVEVTKKPQPKAEAGGGGGQ